MPRDVGTRIGALLTYDSDTCLFLGYGVYEGDFIPPTTVGGLNKGFPNPRLKLDNGETVWGCEVWWGPEAEMKTIADRYEAKGGLKLVDINDYRNGKDGQKAN